MVQIPGLKRRNNCDNTKTDGLSCRISPVVLVTTATSATNALETLAAGAPIMGSVKMATMATGSAIATKVSMELRARTVSRDVMESTAPPVRNTHILAETLFNTQKEVFVCHKGALLD